MIDKTLEPVKAGIIAILKQIDLQAPDRDDDDMEDIAEDILIIVRNAIDNGLR
jgi:hypothetical protein